MLFKKTLSKFIFTNLVFCFHSSIGTANAPSDLTGFKIALKVTNSVDSEGNVDNQEETHSFHFTSNTSGLNREGNNGQWYPETFSWTRKSSNNAVLVIGSTVDVSLNFQTLQLALFHLYILKVLVLEHLLLIHIKIQNFRSTNISQIVSRTIQ